MTQDHAPSAGASPAQGDPKASPDLSGRAAPVTWETFCAGFDRCFGRAYAYASRRVKDQASCERIVSEALEANLDLFADRGDDGQDLRQLKTTLDRLIGLELAKIRAAGDIES